MAKPTEDEQIELIGKTVMSEPANSAVAPMKFALCVDDMAKADRYIAKLAKKFPTIQVMYKGVCEVPGVILVTLMGPAR